MIHLELTQFQYERVISGLWNKLYNGPRSERDDVQEIIDAIEAQYKIQT